MKQHENNLYYRESVDWWRRQNEKGRVNHVNIANEIRNSRLIWVLQFHQKHLKKYMTSSHLCDTNLFPKLLAVEAWANGKYNK